MTGTGRERMLAGIRAGMARQAERRGGSTAPAKPTPLIPARATASGVDVIAVFREQLLNAKATIDEVVSKDDVPAAVQRYLAAQNAESRVRLAPDPRMAGIPCLSRRLIPPFATRLPSRCGDSAASAGCPYTFGVNS